MSNQKPMVSIICPTYNHGKYIEQTLEGFVNQKSTFPFEIIVHDDASTDNTVEIVKLFEAKYPHLFSNIYQTENQFSKAVGNVTKITIAAARGKYIALCEGDDYWIDNYKLQKQIDFLNHNPNYILCFTRGIIHNEFLDIKNNSSNSEVGIEISIEQMIAGNTQITASTVFRVETDFRVPKWFSNISFGDWLIYLLLMNTYNKKAYCLPDITAVYRIHGSGMHGYLHESNRRLIEAYKIHLNFYGFVKENIFKTSYNKELRNAISDKVSILTNLCNQEKRFFQGIMFNLHYLIKGLHLRVFFSNLLLLHKGLIKSIVS